MSAAIRKRFHLPFEITTIEKGDDKRIAFGWAIVCKKDGEDYFDVQGDHIPEDSMMDAVHEFMKTARSAKVMHDGEDRGQVMYSLPLTDAVKKAAGIECSVTGWFVGVEFDEAAWKMVKKGHLKGFSIGGYRGEDEEIEE